MTETRTVRVCVLSLIMLRHPDVWGDSTTWRRCGVSVWHGGVSQSQHFGNQTDPGSNPLRLTLSLQKLYYNFWRFFGRICYVYTCIYIHIYIYIYIYTCVDIKNSSKKSSKIGRPFPFQGFYMSSLPFSLLLYVGSSAGEAWRRLGPRSSPMRIIIAIRLCVVTNFSLHRVTVKRST